MTCQQELMALGKPYPRTCEDCGLFGPCKNTVNSKAVSFPRPSLWLAIAKDGRVKYTTDSDRAQAWKDSGSYRLVRDYYTEPPRRHDTTAQCSYPKCQTTNGCIGACSTEPVAWWDGKESVVFAHDKISTPNWTDYWTKPLYADPTPSETCEALARTVMMDQTSHDTPPPKREWVSVPDWEIMEMYNEPRSDAEMLAFARELETKLRSNNT